MRFTLPKKHAAEETQCTILLRGLKRRSNLNTLQIRERLGIMHSAGCVYILRKNGHKIITRKKAAYDTRGRLHSGVAHYTLLNGKHKHNCGRKYAR